jgi:hypothetical protein
LIQVLIPDLSPSAIKQGREAERRRDRKEERQKDTDRQTERKKDIQQCKVRKKDRSLY